jgi:hypothetical protein
MSLPDPVLAAIDAAPFVPATDEENALLDGIERTTDHWLLFAPAEEAAMREFFRQAFAEHLQKRLGPPVIRSDP